MLEEGKELDRGATVGVITLEDVGLLPEEVVRETGAQGFGGPLDARERLRGGGGGGGISSFRSREPHQFSSFIM
jgi:hypothetical protein